MTRSILKEGEGGRLGSEAGGGAVPVWPPPMPWHQHPLRVGPRDSGPPSHPSTSGINMSTNYPGIQIFHGMLTATFSSGIRTLHLFQSLHFAAQKWVREAFTWASLHEHLPRPRLLPCLAIANGV